MRYSQMVILISSGKVMRQGGARTIGVKVGLGGPGKLSHTRSALLALTYAASVVRISGVIASYSRRSASLSLGRQSWCKD